MISEESRQALNKKMLEFAGFQHFYGDSGEGWIYPNGEVYQLVPDFTDPELGIAYCFKWLVPKTDYDTLIFWNNISSLGKIDYAAGIMRGKDNDLVCWTRNLPVEECPSPVNENPALALCLAVEKLIDGEK